MDKRLLRLAFISEFLLAVIALFTAWSQVGGQGHLDLMPWYLKLALGAGTAYACVKATAAAVDSERAWHGRSLRWFGIMLALLVACGVVTYYYHVNEPLEEEQEEEEPEPAISGVGAQSGRNAGDRRQDRGDGKQEPAYIHCVPVGHGPTGLPRGRSLPRPLLSLGVQVLPEPELSFMQVGQPDGIVEFLPQSG